MNEKRVFIAAYGSRYEAFVNVCPESLYDAMPDCRVDVWLGDVSSSTTKLLANAFPDAVIEPPRAFLNSSDYTSRVSEKIVQWSKWFSETKDGEVCFLLDADTLVRGDIFSVMPQNCDVAFTFKNENLPLNTGVVGAVSNPRTREFFRQWERRTTMLLETPSVLQRALNTAGGADQFAFLDIMGVASTEPPYILTDGPYSIAFDDGELVKLCGVPCSVLNQTNSVPHDDAALVLHYKAKMREVIENDGRFNKVKTAETSRDMVGVWESAYRRHVDRTLPPFVASARQVVPDELLALVRGIPIEPRGMLNSEAALFAGLCRVMGVDSIIESGRARGQSTVVLAQLLPGTVIHSVEMLDDDDSRFGAARVQKFPNVRLHNGTAHEICPRILESTTGTVALVIDGPKGEEAVRLAQHLIARYPQIALVGIHDMHRSDTTARGLPNISRHHFAHAFDRFIFSDHPDLIAEFTDLDAGSGHTPFTKGPWSLGSYGPTLGCAIVTWRDRHRAGQREQKSAPTGHGVWRTFASQILRRLPSEVQDAVRRVVARVGKQ